MLLRVNLRDVFILSGCLVMLACSVHAQELASPQGPVILKISGAIDFRQESVIDSNDDSSGAKTAGFDLQSFEALGLVTLKTETPWTVGLVEFEGVLARDVLERVNAKGQTVRAIALNDYAQEIPYSDFVEIDVIIASRINGETIAVRDNGPLWIIYPWTEKPELNVHKYHSRSVWQLTMLDVIP